MANKHLPSEDYAAYLPYTAPPSINLSADADVDIYIKPMCIVILTIGMMDLARISSKHGSIMDDLIPKLSIMAIPTIKTTRRSPTIEKRASEISSSLAHNFHFHENENTKAFNTIKNNHHEVHLCHHQEHCCRQQYHQ